jgi:hypothetical protein
MTACLAGVINEHPDAKGVMETYLVAHVLPEFQSGHPYLRAVVRASTMHLTGSYRLLGLRAGHVTHAVQLGVYRTQGIQVSRRVYGA